MHRRRASASQGSRVAPSEGSHGQRKTRRSVTLRRILAKSALSLSLVRDRKRPLIRLLCCGVGSTYDLNVAVSNHHMARFHELRSDTDICTAPIRLKAIQ
ncbi:hypothetical protein SAMN05216219_0659 [Mycetocola miduiensis]|uniref:Uncharacterized protein n=1 Tax=Mycetocola miduiensis TaxID=995034 RepID=A0A1I4Z130_9MICO|nr:hypothetical protein SAMN05216219_0659 [Mycetocola miduiensis]